MITPKGAKSGNCARTRHAGRARRRLRRGRLQGRCPEHPTWYHNFLEHPEVDLQDGAEKHTYRVRVAEGDRRAEWWDRAVKQYAPYAEYQQKTDREIPVGLLERA